MERTELGHQWFLVSNSGLEPIRKGVRPSPARRKTSWKRLASKGSDPISDRLLIELSELGRSEQAVIELGERILNALRLIAGRFSGVAAAACSLHRVDERDG